MNIISFDDDDFRPQEQEESFEMAIEKEIPPKEVKKTVDDEWIEKYLGKEESRDIIVEELIGETNKESDIILEPEQVTNESTNLFPVKKRKTSNKKKVLPPLVYTTASRKLGKVKTAGRFGYEVGRCGFDNWY